MTVLDPGQMDIAAAVVAVHAFAAANIEPLMPRGPWLLPQPPSPALDGFIVGAGGGNATEGGGVSSAIWGVLLGLLIGGVGGAVCARRGSPNLAAVP